MLISPAGAVSSSAVVVAPYHGSVSPFTNQYTDGCSHVTVNKPWKFDLHTGLGGAVGSGSAAICQKQVSGIYYGDAYFDDGVQIQIPLKVPTGNHSVSANLAWAISGALKASDGFSSGPGVCNYGVNQYYNRYADYEWNATRTPFGFYIYHSYNETNVDDSTLYGNSSNVYSNAPIPRPFQRNNTSFEDVGYNFGAYANCSSSVELTLYASEDLLDSTNGTQMSMTGNTLQSCSLGPYSYCNPVVDVILEVYNQTSWQCGKEKFWDGPFNTSSTTPFSCSSSNLTTTSVEEINYPSSLAGSITGTNNSLTMTLPGSGAGGVWWNDTFLGKHHYDVELDLSSWAYANTAWKKGTASFAFNGLTSGNGVLLRSISVV